MRFSELIPLTACVVNAGLTVFVITRNLRNRLSWVYLFWGGCISTWNLSVFFMFRVEDPVQAMFWGRILHLGVIFLPVTGFHLSMLVAQVRIPSRCLPSIYLLHAALALSNGFGRLFVAGVHNAGYAYYVQAGPAYWVFAVSFGALALATILIMRRRQRGLPPLHRRRLKVLMLANFILILGGANDILPVFGLATYPLTRWVIFPWGSGAAVIYGMLVGYSAVQHELLDIRITLSRVAAHALRILFVGLTGFLLLLLLAALFPDSLPPLAFVNAMIVLLATTLMAVLCFPRLFGTSEARLERWILADQFEYRDKVRRIIESISAYEDTDLLLQEVHHLLVDIMRARRYSIILLEQPMRVFGLYRAWPEQPARLLPKLQSDSPVFRLFRTTGARYLAFNVAYAMPAETELERAAREQLGEFEPEFCFPLFAESEPFGLLLLGEKAGGALYTAHDQELLCRLAQRLGVVISQIRLKNQVLLAQELELLGRMSRGMAHDLNNLITPVSTFLQMAQLGLLNEENRRELLPVALSGIETIQNYIKEALFVSEQRAPMFRACEVSKLMRETVALHEPAAKRKGVQVVLQTPPELSAEIDQVLVQRLLANLLVNALEASPQGSQVEVALTRLAGRGPHGDWLRLRVSDNGEGMSPAVLKQVSAPYFTTKNRSEGHHAFGLGLAICRKIVHLHGGHLRITSRERQGTTVQVDLPARRTASSALDALSAA